MKRTLTTLLAACLLALASSAAMALEFSADVVTHAQNMVMQGKMYMKDGLVKNEMETPQGPAITIVDTDKNTTTVLMPAQKMYMEMPMPEEQNTPQDPEALEDIATVEELGEETVNGYDCEKRRYTFKDGSGVMTQWVWVKHPIPVKMVMDSQDGQSVTEYTNIQVGNVPDSTFQVPQDYQRFSMPVMNAQ